MKAFYLEEVLPSGNKFKISTDTGGEAGAYVKLELVSPTDVVLSSSALVRASATRLQKKFEAVCKVADLGEAG